LECGTPTAGINQNGHGSDKAGDHRVFQRFHTGLVLEKVLDHFHFALLLVSLVKVRARFVKQDRGQCVCAETEGVISGNLSDRFLADHGNIFSAGFAMATSVPRNQTVDWLYYYCFAGIAKPYDSLS
jgi:hypothetical protein